MASSYQGYARPTSFQQFGPSDAEIRKQQEEDNRKIRALEEQKDALDKRADKSERQLERKLNKEEEQRSKNYSFVEDRSYENRVQAIKTNQKIEEQSYKMLAEEDRRKAEDLMQFSETLTKSLGQFHEKWKKNQMQAGYNQAAMEGLPSESFVDQVEGSNKLYEQHLDIQDIGEALWKQGSPVNVVNNVKRNSAWWEYGSAKYRAEAAGDAFTFWIEDYVRDSGAIQPHEVQEALEKGRKEFLQTNNLYGYSSDFLNPTLQKMGAASRRLIANAQRGKDYVDSQDMVAVLRNNFYQNKDKDSFYRLVAGYMKSFLPDGTRLKGGYKGENYLKGDLTNTDVFSNVVFDELMNLPTTDQPNVLWKDRDKIWYQEVVELRKEDARTRFENRDQEDKFEGKKYLQKIKDEEDLLWQQGKRYDRDQAKEFVRKWNYAKWGALPDHLVNMVTTEDIADEDINERLERKARDGEPIYKEDLYNIDSYELWESWRDIAKDSQNYSLPQEFQELSKERIVAAVNAYKDITEANVAKTPSWIANKQQATRDLQEFYKNFIRTEGSPRNAYLKAIEKVEKKIKDGDYNSFPTSSSNQVFLENRELAKTSIALTPEIVTTSVIPGTEEALKQYRDSGGTIVPKIYEDLANKMALSPTQLANFQLEVVGEGPIKTEADKELEKLPVRVSELLTLHPDKQRVERAKIELLKEDGNITYNEVGYLIDEAVDAQLAEKGYVTPELDMVRPQIGDWKRLPRGTFIKWDGDQWIETGVFFTGRKEFEFPATEYLDRDRVRRKL